MPSSEKILDTQSILSLLSKEGLISQKLPGFELRKEQQGMLKKVVEAYNEKKIALIEAGTGTGKSLAYLIPSVLWAVNRKERVVVSTNTINLQEQLIQKDLPLLIDALGIKTKAVLVKGISNYLCLKKLEELKNATYTLQVEQKREFDIINGWSQKTTDGSKSDLHILPSYDTWEKVCAESDTCTSSRCPYYKECFFFKARKEAQDAQILIANHHLLFADLSRRAESDNYDKTAVLPLYNHVVIDEAHHIEEVATDYFASRVSKIQLIKTVAKLSAERQSRVPGRLIHLQNRLRETFGKKLTEGLLSIDNRLSFDLPMERREILQLINDSFQTADTFMEIFSSQKEQEASQQEFNEKKLRLMEGHTKHPFWTSELAPRFTKLQEKLDKYSTSIHSLMQDLDKIEDEKFSERIESLSYEIQSYSKRLQLTAQSIKSFIGREEEDEKVRWIELKNIHHFPNAFLVDAKLDISNLLSSHLFDKFGTVILCSATLTTNQNFKYFKRRVGLHYESIKERLSEDIFPSPFNFSKQSMLMIPQDLPDPNHPTFLEAAKERIIDTIASSWGNTFVLFTSYHMLRNCYEQLLPQMNQLQLKPMKQGDAPRKALLDQFRETDRAVLFGTDSFWEGVDVAGEALRSVVIVKLPFKVPSEPIIEARCELIEKRGGNAFYEYTIPSAIVKFKQGFGRLIRKANDRGCITCLDTRLTKKNYGKLFLNSLPNCQRVTAEGREVRESMDRFYRQTYHLVKK